jgi:Fe-S-cluster-containing dehydrogenase component
MLIDSEKCYNCGACIVGCQQRNAVPYGFRRNWVRVDAIPRYGFGKGFQPGGCMQCDAPLCVEACPTRATWKSDDGVVLIDRERCIGCGACIAACPYDARYRHPERGTADKCDYCAPSRHLGIAPACVQLCPAHVRIFGDADDPFSEVARVAATQPLLYVESTKTPTKPTLAFVGTTTGADWPRAAAPPLPIAAMRVVSSGIRCLGGLSLFGVIAMFFKQIALPSEERELGPESSASGEGGEIGRAHV